MPKISIITTTYKHQDFIEETIKSVLSQTYTDWELLIWDDSPDDKTWQIIQKYVKKYPDKIKVWHHSINKGIVENMNFLIDKSDKNSKYIAFLEWDDLFTNNNLEEKINIFNKYKDVKLVYNNLDFIDWKWNIFYKNFLKKVPFYLKNEILSKNNFIKYETFYGSYSSLIIDKKVLEKEKIVNINKKDKLFTVSDWDLFFRISNKYNCYWIEKSLTLYRRYENNVSWNTLKLFNDLELQVNYYLKNNFISKELFNYKLAFIYLLKSVSYLEKYDRKNSLKLLFKAIKLNYLSNLIYKIWILILNLLPKFLIKKVLKIIIKR